MSLESSEDWSTNEEMDACISEIQPVDELERRRTLTQSSFNNGASPVGISVTDEVAAVLDVSAKSSIALLVNAGNCSSVGDTEHIQLEGLDVSDMSSIAVLVNDGSFSSEHTQLDGVAEGLGVCDMSSIAVLVNDGSCSSEHSQLDDGAEGLGESSVSSTVLAKDEGGVLVAGFEHVQLGGPLGK
ncbi:MAG: hypothetical protein K2Q09_10195 [Phycisphaerales bacterium]|nr:hypothetical protein [Phycisphaerales bacterium]